MPTMHSAAGGGMSPTIQASAANAAGGTAVVRLRQVTKMYNAGSVKVAAIKGITLEIPSHRFSMIVGPSGSGKTTLLNLIGCIDTPTGGVVEVCGQDIGKLSDN